MTATNRREFLTGVGSTLFAAGVGTLLVQRFGPGMAQALAEGDPLHFDDLEALVDLIQESPPDRLQPRLVARLQQGLPLETLIIAGSLANARTFGGHDYDGYHIQMAIHPALEMAQRLPQKEAWLPVLKVLHRNSRRTQAVGGGNKLKQLDAIDVRPSKEEFLRHARGRDLSAAEVEFAGLIRQSPDQAFVTLLSLMHDDLDVHRVVLVWRIHEMWMLSGNSYAEALMRQSIRYCIDHENRRLKKERKMPEIRALLPQLLSQTDWQAVGSRRLTDRELTRLVDTIFGSTPAEAATRAAAALADGAGVEDVGEALCLAGNRLLLNDPGRQSGRGDDLPRGSVHGASVGVHASDAANAWRNLAFATRGKVQLANLIVGAYHTGGRFDRVEQTAFDQKADDPKSTNSKKLLGRLNEAIEARDQTAAMATTRAYLHARHDPAQLEQLCLKYSVLEDGALHAEKYFVTATSEYARGRKAFRDQHLVGLARVVASANLKVAPGYEQACELVGA